MCRLDIFCLDAMSHGANTVVRLGGCIMLKIDLFKLFDLFLNQALDDSPDVFRLKGWRVSDLVMGGYDLVGSVSDFHLYERWYSVNYGGKWVYVNVKNYFFCGERLGLGFETVGVRLVSLLKHYRDLKGDKGFEFYFFNDDLNDGAVILQGGKVLRFSQSSKRGGYNVVTLEGDFCSTDRFSDISTGMVRTTMEFYPAEKLYTISKGTRIGALRKLVDFLRSS